MLFRELGLSTSFLCETVEQLGYTEPTPIQSKAIPQVLSGKDLLAAAQTGTGKTAAFSLPIIDQMLIDPIAQDSEKKVRCLVLVPTRELAQQVYEAMVSFSKDTGLRCVAVYGGTSIKAQRDALKLGCDIVIATPGRLLDHHHCGHISLKHIEHFVLDEADRMLDMGFKPDIQRILRNLNSQRQTLLFSATFTPQIKALAYKLLNQPAEVEVAGKNSTAATVKEMLYPVDKQKKTALLAYLIGSRNWQQVLVFTKTKEGSDQLVKELKLDGIKAVSINGDKSQGARTKALADFKSGQVRALIATDVAARGLDIPQLDQVVNFDMPFKAEDYVHRIGRTGRAGRDGLAVSLMSHDQEYLLAPIERLLDRRIPQEWLAGFEPSPISESDNPGSPRPRRGRNRDKQKMKAKLKIHSGRGKKKS
ncbi:DEAD/DEAH box helicase [Vibrio sp. S4M6]|uniref:DEAD/DEAH box helicase n=1 Tax=Vibrio sinus TaxID=2946865 RepID=UPI00202AB633|nr:DEAD/DEAH box helicase [Vibrio sinus]MCL9783050.1 DEAD/DEAH box helicase [Vibrio sinus]